MANKSRIFYVDSRDSEHMLPLLISVDDPQSKRWGPAALDACRQPLQSHISDPANTYVSSSFAVLTGSNADNADNADHNNNKNRKGRAE